MNDKKATMKDLKSEFPYSWATIMYIGDQICFPAEFFEAHPEDQRMYYMFGLGTRKDYQGKGIGTELVKQSFEVKWF